MQRWTGTAFTDQGLNRSKAILWTHYTHTQMWWGPFVHLYLCAEYTCRCANQNNKQTKVKAKMDFQYFLCHASKANSQIQPWPYLCKLKCFVSPTSLLRSHLFDPVIHHRLARGGRDKSTFMIDRNTWSTSAYTRFPKCTPRDIKKCSSKRDFMDE